MPDLVLEQDEEKIENKKVVFSNGFRKAGCCGRTFFAYAKPMMMAIHKAGTMKEDMLIDMTRTDGETEADT